MLRAVGKFDGRKSHVRAKVDHDVVFAHKLRHSAHGAGVTVQQRARHLHARATENRPQRLFQLQLVPRATCRCLFFRRKLYAKKGTR